MNNDAVEVLKNKQECEQLWSLIRDRRKELLKLSTRDPLLQTVIRVCFLESCSKEATAAYPPDIACPTCGSLVDKLLAD